MKMMSVAALALMTLCACSGGPVVPDWQMNAKSSLDAAVSAYLGSNERVAAQEFANARNSMAASGQVAQVAKVELMRCAARVASLVLDECDGFAVLRADAAPDQLAYADYLAGRAQPAQAELLPPPQRAALAAQPDALAAALGAQADPFARLVGAGVALRSGRASPAVIEQAIDTASAQGWRRPLLAWLGVQAQRAEQGGDVPAAQKIRRRMELVAPGKP